MSNLNNITESYPSEEPFRLERKYGTGRIKETLCPKCKCVSIPTILEGYDETTGPYFCCTNKDCRYTDIYYKFHRISGNTPLGSPNPEDLVRPVSFEIIQTRRFASHKDRHDLNRGRNSKAEVIPKLGNLVDSDLHAMLKDRGGIIVAIEDQIPGSGNE